MEKFDPKEILNRIRKNPQMPFPTAAETAFEQPFNNTVNSTVTTNFQPTNITVTSSAEKK